MIAELREKKNLRSKKNPSSDTLFPPSWSAATSCEVNFAIDTDFTRCVNSRLGKKINKTV